MSAITLTGEELTLIDKIVARVNPPRGSVMQLTLSMIYCHQNSCRLDLDRMVKSNQMLDVKHDVYGINEHMDRQTKKLTGCFEPRFAKG